MTSSRERETAVVAQLSKRKQDKSIIGEDRVEHMPDHIEKPSCAPASEPRIEWVSDAIAELLRRLRLPYISLNPGSSYRGLHDSLVNYLGNESPRIVVCLHEEHAVAVAHGYAKVTGRPMAVALHSNVGLMHATMALYNAFCDRVPMLVIGATGPVDAALRRPWIDWIHTTADQGALVRNYVKWDDQPASVSAALEAIMRGYLATTSYPNAPVYVCLDSALQEKGLDDEPELPDPSRHLPPSLPEPAAADAQRAAALLLGATRPVLLVGRVGRTTEAWTARVRLAEKLGARVLTDLKTPAAFPSDHVLNTAVPGTFLTESGRDLLADADLVLSLDWIDLAGTLRQSGTAARVISCTLDSALHNGWSKDHFGLPVVDLAIAAHPDGLVNALDQLIDERPPVAPPAPASIPAGDVRGKSLTIRELASDLSTALGGGPSCLIRLPLGWDGADVRVAHPLDYLGQDGGAGLGSGPGMAVGAALALAGGNRLPVAVLGDGDLLMGSSALWTAAHYTLPLLVVVANNGSFFNDEVHQERVARQRSRPVENRWIGQAIRDPEPDLAGLARSLGLVGYGPVCTPDALPTTLHEAVGAARGGSAVLVDVRVSTAGYPGTTSESTSAVSAR
ncbi:MAG TPA: thiamine pyrophosphate-binding protein [Solirubrobacteraceae bacterium]|nr:thiamine pyrophosphate-binding protein [Solirubrobacteraceae bacterium]